ncbi:MAG: CRISPR-associated helicase Cas3' [Clostridiales bacterium]|nr:CRISPR-associated helicase Cas3' [Clostridiales bacterium]
MKEKEDSVFYNNDDKFIAHVNVSDRSVQSVQEHLSGVCTLSEENCPLDILKNISKVIALLHDAGKLTDDFYDYMKSIQKYGKKAPKREVDHASAGARIIEEIGRDGQMAQLAAMVIYSHHGLLDCIDLRSGLRLSESREMDKEIFETVKQRYFQICDKNILKSYALKAHNDIQDILRQIAAFEKGCDCGHVYPHMCFDFGMVGRTLLSLLMDSDWSDAASFSEAAPLPRRISDERTDKIWAECLIHLEAFVEGLSKEHQSALNVYRNEIYKKCKKMGLDEWALYRFTAATGSGKTLSALGFALYHAKKYHKKHIIYVAPYNSILEQNSEVIRKAVGNDTIVLEHHCHVFFEDDGQMDIYKKLTESWDLPIIATTAVQMLETLFSGKKSSIRRMYNLYNSVIIFDEVQALPVRCTELFNLAVNFLTNFCHTTVVLCSATQPSLARLNDNNLGECHEMAEYSEQYSNIFKRAVIEDKTKLIPGGMNIEDLKKFILECLKAVKKILVIVNTKACAKAVYEALKAKKDEFELYHLSTNMCPAHRQDELSSMARALGRRDRRPVICVSTQLVEAGVDISFECVIRSMAGLDHIIQAAGRCNRHKEMAGPGKVYVVKMNPEAENIEGLPEIKITQDAFEKFLYGYYTDLLGNAMDSLKCIQRYYECYYAQLRSKYRDLTKYPEKNNRSTLVELLGENPIGKNRYKETHGNLQYKGYLPQAFGTAAASFEVIPDDQSCPVVIPYNDDARKQIQILKNPEAPLSEKKFALRRLQRYCVGIPEKAVGRLRKNISKLDEFPVFILEGEAYDSKTGLFAGQ